MKTRIIITTIVSFFLLLAVVAAGVNVVFTVTLVDTEFSLIEGSAAGEADAAALKEKLEGYRGRSTTFLSLSEIEEEVAAFPCLRLDSAEKNFPSTISVKISERRQTFAVKEGDAYAILDDTGEYLYSGENVNRTGGSNIELIGFGFTYGRGAALAGDYAEELMTVYEAFRTVLSEVRANVLSVELTAKGGKDFFVLKMHEGITIELEDPAVRAKEKAEAALCHERGYLARTDEERVNGTVSVYVLDADGSIGVNYSAVEVGNH